MKPFTIETAKKIAIDSMEAQGKLFMQFILVYGEHEENHEVHLVADYPDDQKAKESIIAHVMKRCNELSCLKYFHIADTWISGNIFGGRPSKQKERKEAVVVSEFVKGYASKTTIQIYRREGKKIIWEEAMPTGESSTLWNVFMEDAVEEHIAAGRVAVFREDMKKASPEVKAKLEEFAKMKSEVTGKPCTVDDVLKDMEQLVREGKVVPSKK